MDLKRQHFTDAELINSLVNNVACNEAIKFIYREYFHLLSHYVATNNGNEQDAEDNFQEVVVAFISLLKAGRFRGESTVKTFLFSLNRNMWLNELKRRNRAGVMEEKYEKALDRTDLGADENMELLHTIGQLMKILSEVGENCKKILLLFYYENKSMKEIVAELPYENEQVVRNKKGKCLKKLEALVKQNDSLYNQLKSYLHD